MQQEKVGVGVLAGGVGVRADGVEASAGGVAVRAGRVAVHASPGYGAWARRFVVLLLGTLCLHAAPARAAIDAARLTDFVDGAVTDAMQRDHLAGVSVAIVGRDTVLLAKGYGISALDPHREMTADTLCRVGSISKTIVWIGLMRLVEQGKIKLTDPINRYLPKPLQIPDEGFAQPILVWHLMAHTTGFEQSVLGHMLVDDPRRELPLQTYLARYRPHRVLPPGKIAVYSNYATALAGVIISQVSGMPWEEFAERQVLRPLGMRLATFRASMPVQLAADRGLPVPIDAAAAPLLSRGFRWRNDRLEEAPPEFITHYGPAGGMAANATDMAAYMRALLNPETLAASGVLTAESFRTLLKPLFANAPGFGTSYHGFWQYPLPGSRFAFGHDGETLYQRSMMIIAPDLGLGIFVATNTEAGKDLVQRLPSLIGLYLLGENPPPAADPVAANAGTEVGSDEAGPVTASQDIAGTYRPLRRAYFRSERAFLNLKSVNVEPADNGDVVVSGLSDDPVRFAPLHGGVYQALGGGARIQFRREGGDWLLLNPDGVEPLQRIGFFAGSTWLLLIILLAQAAAVGGSIQLLRDIRSRGGSGAGCVWHVGSALWLSAFVLAWIAIVPWLLDIDALVMEYPGRVFPVACWLFAAAALITAGQTVGVLAVRPRTWAWRRWVGVAASYVIFGACAVTLRYWGLLGFSGW
jgi:CubicO group peptidase (beta-lactamase class C family)